MRLLLIVTADLYELWERSETWLPALKDFQKTTVRMKEVGDDRILVLCQADSRKANDEEAIIESREKTTLWLIELATRLDFNNAHVYVAAHAGHADFEDLQKDMPKGRFRAGADFSHQPGLGARELFDYLCDLFKSPDAKSFQEVINFVSQRDKSTRAQRLAKIKDQLTHLFLPVTGDLHLWETFGFDDAYLQQICDSYKSGSDRLDLARKFLYSESAVEVDDNVENLILEAGLDDDATWNEIKFLLPPSSSEADVLNNHADACAKFLEAKTVLESLNNHDKLIELRSKLRNDNPFVGWYKQLDDRLKELVAKLEH